MAERERGIVTPEAVLLEFDTAQLGSRTVAILIDLLVMFAGLMAVVMVLGAAEAGGLPDVVGVVFVVIALFGVFFGYPIGAETLWSGRTLGKAAMGLRVVTREGAPIRFRHAAIRGALGLVDLYLLFGAVAVVTSLLTRDGQRLGDLAAGTIVLRERTARAHTTSMTFPVPPGWESYVGSLDVSGVSTEQYGLVRDFLLRVNDLSQGARAQLGVRLADPLAATMRHRVPAGVAPESFLVCVAAAFQQRRGLPGRGPVVGRGPRPRTDGPPPPTGRPVSSVPPPPATGPAPAGRSSSDPPPPSSSPPPPPRGSGRDRGFTAPS